MIKISSPWENNLYLAVDKPVEKTDNVSLTGSFLFKAYEGPFKDAGKWMADNYVVVVGQVS